MQPEKHRKEPIVIHPKSKAECSVIWLHGLGADGNDFVPIIDYLALPKEHKIRFVFPQAPVQKVSINQGMSMPAWYDIKLIDLQKSVDEKGLYKTHDYITTVIENEITSGIDSTKIILGGFSQGGAVSLFTGLRLKVPLAGIFGLSTYIPLMDKLAHERHPSNFNTPILLVHGLYDPVVPYHLFENAEKFLTSLNYTVNRNTFSMQHTVSTEEIEVISEFIQKSFLLI